jgi:hypothetical protein
MRLGKQQNTYKATCRDGPLIGQVHDGKGKKGIVFIDKPTGTVYVYNFDRRKHLEFQRQYRYDKDKHEKAMFDIDRDVRAVP